MATKAKNKTTTSCRRRRRITERQQRVIVERTMGALQLRDAMREMAAARRRFDRQHTPVRRIASKLAAFLIVAGILGIVIGHAITGS